MIIGLRERAALKRRIFPDCRNDEKKDSKNEQERRQTLFGQASKSSRGSRWDPPSAIRCNQPPILLLIYLLRKFDPIDDPVSYPMKLELDREGVFSLLVTD